jgi:hypothetical protein
MSGKQAEGNIGGMTTVVTIDVAALAVSVSAYRAFLRLLSSLERRIGNGYVPTV